MDSSGDASQRLALELHIHDAEGPSRPTTNRRSRKRKASDFDVAVGAYQEHLSTEIQSVGGRLPAPPADALPSRPRKRHATEQRKVPTPATRVNPPRRAKASVSQTAAPVQTAIVHEASLAEGLANSNNALRCVVCYEVLNEDLSIRAPCNDLYCGICLVGGFTAALAQGGSFPFSCCSTPIPLTDALRVLPDELVFQYKRKQLELNTPNPLYCHNGACAVFIPPSEFVEDRAPCPSCREQTCILCRDAAHDGVCADDPARAELLDMACAEGWKAYS
ncbi:hypothetical protein LLEC1_03456 [Akanthomyces lecanii]|uniref:IBR domain-containing protein n=1 Tax=Cordyceps confragosa TaxID=2714763 RepID=A0A179IUX9_CORDF|nr:hypothetical protein LLEC1_03456 [Akanthomyces lecanii]